MNMLCVKRKSFSPDYRIPSLISDVRRLGEITYTNKEFPENNIFDEAGRYMEKLFEWLPVILLIILGVMVKYLKMHWLIAGYNTSPAQARKEMSEKGIGNFMGNMLFVLAGVIALGNLGAQLGYVVAQPVSWGIFLLVVMYIIIGARRFAPEKASGRAGKGGLIITGVVFLLVAGLFIIGERDSTIEVLNNQIRIGGMYSTKIDLNQVADIRLEDTIPLIKSKTNGYSTGFTRKGYFLLQDIGRARLYLHSNHGPYIYILNEGKYVIINFDDREKTEQLFVQLHQAWSR
ncbi:MAG: DUF3784 domain-containing protein [Syntrophomonadaceae bacterium]|nr:DUF3784 domain-containing protein [Syntrophomonadaceae bacterium]